MSDPVRRHDEIIPQSIRQLISLRYKTITKAINKEFWNSNSDVNHSLYVGSYGRRTAVSTSDIDILVELPNELREQFNNRAGNVQSQFLQSIKLAIQAHYNVKDIHADGQIIKIDFYDDVKFEILPAFNAFDPWNNINGYYYPDSNSGGSWRFTNPKAEQDAIWEKDKLSNGLCIATCRHIRRIRDEYFKSYHLSGIVIDSFVYNNMGNWEFAREEHVNNQSISYEQMLLNCFNRETTYNILNLKAPGSDYLVDAERSIECLRKVLEFMA